MYYFCIIKIIIIIKNKYNVLHALYLFNQCDSNPCIIHTEGLGGKPAMAALAVYEDKDDDLDFLDDLNDLIDNDDDSEDDTALETVKQPSNIPLQRRILLNDRRH